MSKQHPFDKGERVHVYNQTAGGKPMFEGTATVLAPGEVADQYRVRFDSDRSTVLRFVYPHGQVADPQAYAAQMVAEWQTPQHYLALTLHFWGKGTSERSALAELKRQGGTESLRRNGYLVYRCHPDTYVDESGAFCWHPDRGGFAPVMVADHRKP